MQTGGKSRLIRVVVFILIAIALYFLYSHKSKAEELPEHHYNTEFETPDPSADIYDVIESDNPIDPEPIDPYLTFNPNLTFNPINPSLTSPPAEINGRPLPANLKYDPFLIRFELENGESVETWKRLNGTPNTYYPPVSTSFLHTVAASATPFTETTDAWMAEYRYSLNTNGVDQANSWFRPNAGALGYVIYQDMTTAQTARRLSKGDYLEFSFVPNLVFMSTIADEMYDPAVRINIMLTFINANGASNTITVDPIIGKLSDNRFSFRYQIEQSSLVYLSTYRIEMIVNPFDLITYEPTDPSVIYWFETSGNGSYTISFWHDKTFMESVGSWFSQLFSNIQYLFVPNTDMIQTWISDHASDELDSDNPLNLVKDLYVSLMDKFTGYSPNGRPVIDVPALSFNISGYGKVTPFEGYEWQIGNDGVIDGEGRSIWYYVKLSTSILIASGLIGKMWSWFKKWYDAHYAADGGSE